MRIIELRDIPGSENILGNVVAAWFDFDKFSLMERHDFYSESSSVSLSFSGSTVSYAFYGKGNADKFIKGVLDLVKENAQ